MKKVLFLILGIFALVSCSQNEPISYVDNPAIYIASDNINYSFFYSATGADEDNVNITVHAMGNPSDIDRPFSLIQANTGASDAAVAGTHFLAFDSNEMKSRMVMPAGKSEVKVPITLLKDASLNLKTVKLIVRVAANDNFKTGVIEKDSTVVTFSSQAIKPTNWDDWYYAFGASWGSVKMRFIIDVTGITNFDTVPSDYSYLIYLNSKLKQKMYEYNEAHPNAPLAEADGTLLEFENPYRR
jgi:hypothetical protein